MSLCVKLAPEEAAILNGAVVENADPKHTIRIRIRNFAHIIREQHILKEEDANTPVKRLYFVIQCMLIDAENADDYRSDFACRFHQINEIFKRHEEMAEAMDAVKTHVEQGDYYKALMALRPVRKRERVVTAYSDVVRHEQEVLTSDERRVVEGAH